MNREVVAMGLAEYAGIACLLLAALVAGGTEFVRVRVPARRARRARRPDDFARSRNQTE